MQSMEMAYMSHYSDTTAKEPSCYYNPVRISSCNAGNMESPFPALEIRVNFQLEMEGKL